MNNIKLSGPLPHAWIEVNITGKIDDANYTVSSQLFDSTPFSVNVSDAKLEFDSTNEKKALLDVGVIGTNSLYTEVMLPAPVLNMGYTIRVSPSQIVNQRRQLTNVGTKIKK